MHTEELQKYDLPEVIQFLIHKLSTAKSGSYLLNIEVAIVLNRRNSTAQRTTDLTSAKLMLDFYGFEKYSIVKDNDKYRCIINGHSVPCNTAPLAICATIVLLKH